MLQKFFVIAVLMLSASSSQSQIASSIIDTMSTAAESEKKDPVLTITGSADVYYKYDLARTKANSFTSFTQTHNSFALGMASVKFAHKSDKIELVADLGFGQRAKEFSYADEGITQVIKQAYVSYSPAEWIKLTAGSWATHVGYELLDPQLNRNYSMSYLFTNGPFSHTGIKAEVSKGKHGFMVGVSNATDFRTPPDGYLDKKFLIAQYSVAPYENIKLYVNYVGGQNPDTSRINQVDAVVTAGISDVFSVGVNGTYASVRSWDGVKNLDGEAWWGAAVYLIADPKSWLGISLRSEYFNDENQFRTFGYAAEGGSIFSNTLSVNLKKGSFTLIPEIRHDRSDKAVLFVDEDGMATKSFTSFLLAAIYSF